MDNKDEYCEFLKKNLDNCNKSENVLKDVEICSIIERLHIDCLQYNKPKKKPTKGSNDIGELLAD